MKSKPRIDSLATLIMKGKLKNEEQAKDSEKEWITEVSRKMERVESL